MPLAVKCVEESERTDFDARCFSPSDISVVVETAIYKLHYILLKNHYTTTLGNTIAVVNRNCISRRMVWFV